MITKVLLHDRKNQRYYAGPGHWVKHPDQAADLGDIPHAAKAFTEEELSDAEIVLDNGELPAPPPKPAAAPKARSHLRRHR